MDRRRAAAALLALAACIACSAAAPTTSDHTALQLHDDSIEGCYYNFQHYGEGDRIMTNEPCLNCTCHNRMLMCYLRVCPFTKAIGQDCTVEKRADQCCPIVTCPDVPVDLLTSTSTSSPAEYGTTGLGKLDKYGCSIHGKYFPEGSKVPSTPNKPCEHCYCIRNMTTCVMQECTLHVDGCTPIYHKDVCCPVRYSCDHTEDEIPLLDDMTTTVRPTPGFLLTTSTVLPVTQMSQDCVHDDQIFPDGALIKTEKACEHCYCMKGDIVCVVQECGTPMENEGKSCTSLPPRHGQCCPDTYICEGDEHVADSTTDIGEVTTLPPRRVGVEGSGYRNEPDEPYTEMSPVTTDIEGSGEDFVPVSQIDTVENVTPEKALPEIVDDTLLPTTETNLQLIQSTEPDKSLNTIPDSMTDMEMSQEPIQNKVTLSDTDESLITISEVQVTTGYLMSRKDVPITTESAFRKDDDTISDKISTAKEYERSTIISTDVLGESTFEDEHISHTSPKIIDFVEQYQTATTPSTEFTNKVHETPRPVEISTELASKVTDNDKFVDEYPIPSEKETSEVTINPVTNVVLAETTMEPIVDGVDDKVLPISSPSRIPGEGDCLLNGITYINNTSVPSRNNCHTGCKCISSIIKCDPIICSPPPEYMENMNDCQPVYDTPDSCCPTYVCSVKETIPPQSHSQMSGTESPKPIAASECSGSDCIVSSHDQDETSPLKPSEDCPNGNCQLSPTKPCDGENCKTETPTEIGTEKDLEPSSHDQAETSPSKPFEDCTNGSCQISPTIPCDGENCKTETPTETVTEKDVKPSSHDQDETSPSKPAEDCINGNCQISPTIPCDGENCKMETPSEIVTEKDLEPSSHDHGETSPSQPSEDCTNGTCQISPTKPCDGENCKTETPTEIATEKDLEPSSHDHGETSLSQPAEDCINGNCQISPTITCDGENCKTETPTEIATEKDLEPSSHDHGETSPSKPSEDCSNGNCQISPTIPCDGENCKTETPTEIATEKDLEPSSHDHGDTSPSQPSEDCSNGNCQISPTKPCDGENCKTETPTGTVTEKDLEPSSYDHGETSSSKPSEDCSNGNCQISPTIPCDGENCKTETPTEIATEKDLEPSSHDHGDTSPSQPSDDCSNGNCQISPTKPCDEENCKTETPTETVTEKDLEPSSYDHGETSSSKPSEDCSNGNCQISPTIPCDGENCKTETPTETVTEKDVKPSSHDQDETSPSKPAEDCINGNCQISPTIPCDGENCKMETPSEIVTEKDLEPSSHDHGETSPSQPSEDCTNGTCQISPTKPCDGENCKTETPTETVTEKDVKPSSQDQDETSPSKPAEDCINGNCQISPTIPCDGENCKMETPSEIVTEKDLEPSSHDHGETSPSQPSEDCTNGNCQILSTKPCDGENCKTETPTEIATEKDLEPSSHDHGDTSPSQPSEDCSNGNCQISSTIPCDGENCKTETPTETVTEKDVKPISHDLPLHICNEENGCKEQNIAEHHECVDENCKRKEELDVQKNLPSECSGTDCKPYDKSTIPYLDEQSSQQTYIEKSTQSTISDVNLQKTVIIESHITTSTEKLTESNIEVTIQPFINTGTPEKLSTAFNEIITKPSKIENEFQVTDVSVTHTATETYEEDGTKTDISKTESPKLSDIDISTDRVIHNKEPTLPQDTTEKDTSATLPPKYLETQTESFNGEYEKFTTKPPHSYTDSDVHGTVSDEIYTKLPQMTVTEVQLQTDISEPTVTKKIIETEPAEMEIGEIGTKSPEILVSQKETVYSEPTEGSFTVVEPVQTKLPNVMEEEIHTETPVPESVVTEKDLIQTVVTEIFTEVEDIKTKAPENIITEKDVSPTEIPKEIHTDNLTTQTETPEIVVAVKKPTPPTDSITVDIEKQIQTDTPHLAVTLKETNEISSQEPVITETPLIQTGASEAFVNKTEEINIATSETVTKMEDGPINGPDKHEIKLEPSGTYELDKVEEGTTENIITEADLTNYVSEGIIKEPQDTLTVTPETSDEISEVHDELYTPKPVEPVGINTKDKTDVATEPTVTVTPYETVTDLLSDTEHSYIITSENIPIDLTTKKVIIEDEEIYTKLPVDFITKAGANDITTVEKELLYTTRPDIHETKSDDISQTYTTESQAIITDKYKESSITDTQSSLLPTHETTEKLEKYTETPETYATISLTQDKATTVPELTATLTEETLITDKDIEKQHTTSTTTSSEKGFDDEKDINVPDEVHRTTIGDIEEVTVADSSKIITEKQDMPITEPADQQTLIDLKLDTQSSHVTTSIKDSENTPESYTDISNIVTEVTTTHSEFPVATEEKQQKLTTKTLEEDLSMATKYPYKETTSDGLTTESPNENELFTEKQPIVSQETSVVDNEVTEPYVETSTKTFAKDSNQQNVPEIEIDRDTDERGEPTTTTSQIILQTDEQIEKEIVKEQEQNTTKPLPTQINDQSKLESTPSFAVTPEIEIVTATAVVDFTDIVQDVEGEMPYNEDISKPLIPKEKPSELENSTKETGLQDTHLREHTAFDSLTTQTPSHMLQEISTEQISITNIEATDKNVQSYGEVTTAPEAVTINQETTTSHITYTISENIDKMSTIVLDNKELEKAQEPYSDKFVTTSSSIQQEDYNKITELPMALVTNVDHAQSTQTAILDKDEIGTEPIKKPNEQELEDNSTDLVKPPMKVPELNISPQEPVTESSSEIKIEDSNTLATHHEERTTPSIVEAQNNLDHKTADSSIKQTDTVRDFTTTATISSVDRQNTEATSVLDIEKESTNNQHQKTTTVISLHPIEKETDHSHEHQSSITEPDEITTKMPHEKYTTLGENNKTPPELQEGEGEGVTEQGLGTKYPETNTYEVHSTFRPEKDTSGTEGVEVAETSKLSTATEPDIGISHVPIATEVTKNPISPVTDMLESGITEQYQKPTELVIPSDEKTTTRLEVVTEKENLYTQGVPSETTDAHYTDTQQKEDSTEGSEEGTRVADEVNTSTQSLLTELPKHEVITGGLDQEDTNEHKPSDGVTQLPEPNTLIPEIQTDSNDVGEFVAGTTSKIGTRPALTEIEYESQTEILSTQRTIEKEDFTTSSSLGDLSIQTDKTLTDVHVPTEFTLTTLGILSAGTQSTQTHKEFDLPEGPNQNTELDHIYSETTPFLVELEEHTHQVIDESSRTSIEEEITTAHYVPQQPERGDQDFDVTDKYEHDYHTSTPMKDTEHDSEDKEKPITNSIEETDQKIPITTSSVKDFTEPVSRVDSIPTTSSPLVETEIKGEKEKHTTFVQDLIVSTSMSPQSLSDKEPYTTTSTDLQKSTFQIPDISTEKNIYLNTEPPLKSQSPIETTFSDEHLVHQTTKATTSEIKEETSTHSPITTAKSTQNEEKPIVTTLSPMHEMKPGFDDETNGVPSPDFPPSGTGGYGQAPDYIEEDQAFGPGTCRYGGKVYVSAQQIPRDDPCDFCFCFRSDIICLQQSCPPPIHGCHEEPIQGFCCPRYECPVSMATTVNVTTTTTTTTTTLPPHFFPHAYKGAAQRRGCQIKGHTYKVGEVVRASSGPCLHCTCGGDGQMKCDPKACTPEPMLRQMIAAAVSAKRRR